MTLGEKLDQSRGFSRGFDFLRVLLALAIVAGHSVWVSGSDASFGWTRATWFAVYAAVPCFFTISGFLIAASAERLPLGVFLLARALRIVPALAVEIMISAFVLGPIFTTWPLAVYLTSPRTWQYLTNVVGVVNYRLPGVFEHLPQAGIVNISLWTIPFEIIFYGLVALIIATGLMRRRGVFLVLALLWAGSGIVVEALHLAKGASLHANILQHLYFAPGPGVGAFAAVGVTAYQFRYRIAYSRALLGAAIGLCAATWAWAPAADDAAPGLIALTCVPLVYITLFIGVSDVPPLPFFHRGDYSYGIYLYSFPLQQAVKSALPQITSPWRLTAVATVLIVLFAAFSWHCIERPILRLRKKFSFVAGARLAEAAAQAPARLRDVAGATTQPAE